MRPAATATNGRVRHWRRESWPAPTTVFGEVSLSRVATLPADTVLQELGADGDGLSLDEARVRLEATPSDPAEAPNLVFAGTYVASGSGWVVVVATGARTRLGTISRLTGEVARRPTPLRLDLNRSVRTIGGSTVGTGVVFFGVSLALGTPVRAGSCWRSRVR